ncbi:MAG: TIGR00730 family Rossman fold protein, partial [Anaerolineae bacterium]|nr:TIGR00730 family Rossman fold protein [Anaerolineae bacterium]
LRVVNSMHERKALMADLADAFIALPGGFGTLDEMAEIFTWAQLSLHTKPCGLLNVCGYYDPLISFFDRMHQEGFVDEEHRNMVVVEENPAAMLQRFETYQPPHTDKAALALHQSALK